MMAAVIILATVTVLLTGVITAVLLINVKLTQEIYELYRELRKDQDVKR